MLDRRKRGVAFTPLETRRELIVELAMAADRLGYDSVGLAEGWAYDSSLVLSEIGARTKRIRLMSTVISVWSRSPGTIAMSAATLQEQTAGRYVLGLGTSARPLTEGFHDRRFSQPIERLRTTLVQVRALLRGERIPLEGDTRALRLGLRDVPEVPIFVAGLATRTLRLTGQLADGWLPFFFPRSQLGEALAKVDEGRSVREDSLQDEVTVAGFVPALVSPNGSEAKDEVGRMLAFYLVAMGDLYAALLSRLGFADVVETVQRANERPTDRVFPAEAEALLDEITVCGRPEPAIPEIERWHEAGVDEVLLLLPPGAPEDLLRFTLGQLRPS